MGGKKKKSLANKLSKMTDEERARYLQHRADMEEEAKRRKEQLIATFMKKKIKKEEGFARLNLAKINQNWHQILRKIKCKEMKEEVEHMKGAIERILAYKNRTISKLLEELEEAEEQYLNNFQTHAIHIDRVIDDQDEYIEKLQKEYEDDLEDLIETTTEEQNLILNNADEDQKYLQTVIFGQNFEASKLFQQSYEHYMQQLYESECKNGERLKRLQRSRARASGELWRQAASAARRHVRDADARRLCLAELRRLDAAAAAGVAANEERIRREEKQIETLKNDYEFLVSKRTEQIKNLEIDVKQLNTDFIKVRKDLQIQLQLDEKKLRFLTSTAQNAVGFLTKVLNKGLIVRNLAETCKKFETEREKLTKWFPICDEDKTVEQTKTGSEQEQKSKADDEKLLEKPLTDKDISEAPPRPKTAIHLLKSDTSDTSTTESKKPTIKDVSLSKKDSKTSSKSSEESVEKDIVQKCYESLAPLDNFWLVYNKTEVGYMEIKEERKVLLKENRQLRAMIRAILEAAASMNGSPENRVSSRLPSKIRNTYSAPVGMKIL